MQSIFGPRRVHRSILPAAIGSACLLLFVPVANAQPPGNPAVTPSAQRAELAQAQTSQTETSRPDTNAAVRNAEADRSASDQQSSSVPSPAPTPLRPKLDGPQQYCKALEEAALENDLPPDFFVRLIWQESNFDPNSVSSAGAQGIAQFMPGTARWRGLADPFEPLPALQESARWLRELRAQFGNLGLAAAAYNGGPRRVQDWLAGRGSLPGETRAYVRMITGRSAEEWAQGSLEDRVHTDAAMACGDIVRGMLVRALPAGPRESVTIAQQAAWGPWGLQLAGGPSQSRVLADYQQLQKRFASVLGDRAPLVLRSRMAGPGSATWYLLRVAETTRERANQLCARLEAVGGRCLVFRN
ncbi:MULTISPECIES: lytic transglycosylase domain-containing protein [Bradyrhizobium]|uniref:Transglycosylase SLT domain-containing protein n=1 Tax=Bradyrhizobium brasilense TaxID=1419277 RepID=A0ABY8JDV1_9BRAD|nr:MULTISPECIES: lytic transglycosylase domain-containing protein [Bradyrhizobium]WFU62128.1 transglycosylase SLT domain-containing protein [Bradyrhizobium brasilense]